VSSGFPSAASILLVLRGLNPHGDRRRRVAELQCGLPGFCIAVRRGNLALPSCAAIGLGLRASPPSGSYSSSHCCSRFRPRFTARRRETPPPSSAPAITVMGKCARCTTRAHGHTRRRAPIRARAAAHQIRSRLWPRLSSARLRL
jgi:hypothetical protein